MGAPITTMEVTYNVQGKYSGIPLAPKAFVLEIQESILLGLPVVPFGRTKNHHTRQTDPHFLSCGHFGRHHR